jgi:Skp family chaperone for outer membrane proteins
MKERLFMKKNIICSLVLCGTVTAGALAAKDEQLNIAFVDTFKAMRECKEGEQVSKEMDALRETATNKIRQKAELIAKKENDLKGKASMLKPQEMAKQGRELEKEKRDLEESVKEEEEQLQLVMRQKTEELAVKIEEGVVSVAKARNVDAVIDKMTGRVMYTKENYSGDLTNDAIKAVNDRASTLAKADTKKQTATT